MRLAVISDVHGNLAALEAVLADAGLRAPDLTVNLGDCVTSPLWPRETWELLDTLRLATVRGNHDRVIAWPEPDPDSRSVQFTHARLTESQRAALGALPATLRVDTDILAVHGTPSTDTEYLLQQKIDGRLVLADQALIARRLGDERASLILCGHSHTQHVASLPDGTLIVNPGSVGAPRYADDGQPHIAEAGSPHARYAIATRRGQRWSVDLISLAYDWSPVVEQATRNGRSDWANGFLGRVDPIGN